MPALANIAALRRHRNAAPPGFRELLARWRADLLRLYQWRPDTDANGYRMPYLPVPFAESMLRVFRKEAQRWITSHSVPVEAIQPEFIRGKLDAATDALGRWQGDRIAVSPEAVEPAPERVRSQPQPELAPGLGRAPAHPSVVRVANTARILDNLRRLATHFDILDTQPGKLEIAAESVGEAVGQSPRTIQSGLSRIAHLAERVVDSAIDAVLPEPLEPKNWSLMPLLLAGGAAVGLYMVVRK